VPVTLGALLLVAGIASAGFFVGQSLRLSGEEVERRLEAQARHDNEQKRLALARQKRALEQSYDKRLKRETQEAAAEGQSQGQTAGYSSGQKSGFDSGKAKGRQEGEGEGYGEGWDDGYEIGREEGYDEGYEDGS
jgi:flagellar biosynthesis/type III secretory pathway protein FliH